MQSQNPPSWTKEKWKRMEAPNFHHMSIVESCGYATRTDIFWVLLLVPAYLCCPCGTPLWCLEFVRVLKVLCSDTNQAVWRWMVRRPAKCPSEIWGARMSASAQDGYRNSKPWSSFFCTQANLDSSFNSNLIWSLLVQLLASWYI